MAEVGGMSFEQAQAYRRAVFDLVADPLNWKRPIDKTIEFSGDNVEEFLAVVSDAVCHFVGAKPQFEILALIDDNDPCNKVRVVSTGYYNIVGA